MFAHARRLRWSGELYGYDIGLEAIVDPSRDVGVPGGSALLGLVDAFMSGTESDQEAARRSAMEQLGPEGFVDAAAVFANFEMMNRVAEGTGIPVPPQAIEREAELVRTLGLHELFGPELGSQGLPQGREGEPTVGGSTGPAPS